MRILASPQFYLKVVKRLITASNLSSMHGSYYDIEFKPLFPFNTLNLQRLLSDNLERWAIISWVLLYEIFQNELPF